MHSTTERFPDKVYGQTPFGVYNTDTGHKKTVSTGVRDSKQLLAASFSKSSRWSQSLKTSAPDVVYDTDVGRFKTLSTEVGDSPITYSIVRSKYRRLGPLTSPTDAPDVEYDTNVLHKAAMTTAVQRSPLKYSIIHSSTKRFPDRIVSSTPNTLGPGSYDPPPMLDLRRSQSLKPLSSFSSTSTRFGEKQDPTKWLGGTWSPEKDKKKWAEKGNTFSKAEVRRPQYLPP